MKHETRSTGGRPRIRTLKPETWQDERVGALDIPARHLRTVLITMADDEGRFRALPSAIIGFGYPYDDHVTAVKVKKWLTAIAATGMIVLYEVEGIRYGYFPHWLKHQRVNKPSDSLIPAPPSAAGVPHHSGNDHGTIPERWQGDSGNDPGTIPERSVTVPCPPRGPARSRSGTERNGADQERSSTTTASATARSVPAFIGDLLQQLRCVPQWERAIDQGGDAAVLALVQAHPGVPWLDLTVEAVASRLDPSVGSLRTDSPVRALTLKLDDHRTGKRGGGGRPRLRGLDDETAARHAEEERILRGGAA